MTKDMPSANQRISRSRRGKMASSRAPANGRKVTMVMMLLIDVVHRTPFQTMKAITTAAPNATHPA